MLTPALRSLVYAYGLFLMAIGVYFAMCITGHAAERYYFRESLAAFSPPKPVKQVVIYEKKCSFNVVKLEPGTYRTVATDTIAAVGHLWDSLPSQTNLWFYGHVSGDCVAIGKEVGYRYAWTTTTEKKLVRALTDTGIASGKFENGRLYFDVTAPMWLAGEVAQGLPVEKVF